MVITFILPPSPAGALIIRQIDCSHQAKAAYLWHPYDMLLMSGLLDPDADMTLVDGTADQLGDAAFFQSLDRRAHADLFILGLASVAWSSDLDYLIRIRKRYAHMPLFIYGDVFLESSGRAEGLPFCDGIILEPHRLDLAAMAARQPRDSAGWPGVLTRSEQLLFSHPCRSESMVLPHPPRHDLFLKPGYRFPFAHQHPYATITSLWGCPFSCDYCTDRLIPPRVRGHQEVLAELEQVQRLGIRELFFSDKVFGFPLEDRLALLRAMVQRFQFSWSCYFHPQLYREELLDLMADAGCHTLIVGVDSADQAALQVWKRKVDDGRLAALLAHARRRDLSVCADFIIGLDHETESDIRATLRFALEAPIDFASFNIATPLPGSGIRDRAQQEQRLDASAQDYCTRGRRNVLDHPALTGEQLRRLRHLAIARFYLRPSLWWRRLRRTRSLEHLLIQLRQLWGMATG
ncbi:MAG: radical SAM protein [Magnetococcus sp. WYHC-3]